jgi:AcrR family transcriptional regulator
MKSTAPSATAPSARAQSTRRPYAARMPVGERREAVLDAALHIAATAGFAAVTMEAVAREAGVTKPVVYELFPQRGALQQALLEREEQRALAGLRAFLPAALGPVSSTEELVRPAMTGLLTAVVARPDAWRILLQSPEGMPPVVRERFLRRRGELVAGLGELIGQARGRGFRTGPSDTELLAETVVALAELAGQLALRRPAVTMHRLTDYFTDLMVGILDRGQHA